MKSIIPMMIVLAALIAASQAHAQTDAPAPTPTYKCRAAPDANDGAAGGEKSAPAGDSLTDTLADCGGVLKPPATGDSDISEPAPAQGETPVIKPDDLPVQQPPAQ